MAREWFDLFILVKPRHFQCATKLKRDRCIGYNYLAFVLNARRSNYIQPEICAASKDNGCWFRFCRNSCTNNSTPVNIWNAKLISKTQFQLLWIELDFFQTLNNWHCFQLHALGFHCIQMLIKHPPNHDRCQSHQLISKGRIESL